MSPTLLPSPTITPSIETIQQAYQFFHGFNFDTLLSLISCITGIIALFVSNAAYTYCLKIENKLIENKVFSDRSQDHSQFAAGDIINVQSGIGGTELSLITNGYLAMTNATVSKALDKAYIQFQEQCDENIQKIFSETQKEIEKHRYQIASYTKLDWIHVYLESAKNTSDEKLQKIWAKVLARELAFPNSFGYKTLEILKNMTDRELLIFEELASVKCESMISKDFIAEAKENNFNFSWASLQRVKEHGIINLELSQQTFSVPAKNLLPLVLGNSFMLILSNPSEETIALNVPGYLFTSSAKELLPLFEIKKNKEDAIHIVDVLKKLDKTNRLQFYLWSAIQEEGSNQYCSDEFVCQR